MKLTQNQLDWANIIPILRKGVKMSERGHHLSPQSISQFVSPTSKIAFESARSTKQMEIGQDSSSPGIIDQLKTGDLFPDQLVGISTKTILAALLIFMIIRGK